MVRREKRADPLTEVYIHNRPSPDRGIVHHLTAAPIDTASLDKMIAFQSIHDSVSIDPRSSLNSKLSFALAASIRDLRVGTIPFGGVFARKRSHSLQEAVGRRCDCNLVLDCVIVFEL